MNTNMKKILLTGSALVAVSFVGVHAANAQTIGAGQTTPITNAAPVIFNAADAVGTLSGGPLSHDVTASVAGHGTLQIIGSSTINNAVGTGAQPIGTIDIAGPGSTVIFGSTVNANSLTLTTPVTVNFGGNAAITNQIALGGNTLNAGAGAQLTLTGGVTGTGFMELAGGSSVSGGAISLNTLSKATAASTGTFNNAGTITTVNVNAGRLDITNAATTVSGTTALNSTNTALHFAGSSLGVVTSASNTNSLTLNGAGAQAITGTVGASGASVGDLNISGGLKTFNADVHATSLTIDQAAAGTAGTGVLNISGNLTKSEGSNTEIANQLTLGGNVALSSGTLTLSNAATTVAGTTTINGSSLNFGGASLGGNVTGNGSLNLVGTGAQAVNGTIGTSAADRFGIVRLSGDGSTKTFAGNVWAGTTEINGGVTTAGAGAINSTTFTKTAADAGIATVGNALTATNLNVQNGTLNLSNSNNIAGGTVNMGVTGQNYTTVLNGTLGNVAQLNHAGGTSTVSGIVTATNTGIAGGGTMTVSNSGSSVGAVTFGAGGGTLAGAGGASATSVNGAAALDTVGQVDSQVTNANVTNLSTQGGTIYVANGASTLNNVEATSATSSVRFFGSQINGTVTGGGTLELNGSAAQQVASLGTDATTRLGTVSISGGGAKTIVGNAFVSNLNILGNNSTTGGVINATTLTKSAADADTATIGNILNATNVNVRNGTLTLNGAGSTVTTLELGESGQARTVTFNGTDTPASIATVRHVGTGASTVANATAITNASVEGGSLSFGNAGTTVTNATFTGAGTLNLANLTTAGAQAITFAGNQGTVAYGANTNFTGSATTTTSNTGNLTFGNDATIAAAATIGGANKLNDVSFAGGTNTINSAVNANRVVLNGGNVSSTNTAFNSGIHFASDNAFTLAANTATVGGNVTTATAGTGTLNFSGTGLTINGDLGQLAALSLANSTVAPAATALTVTGNAVAANAMNIGSRNMQVNGTFTTAGANTLLDFYVVPNAINPAVNPPVTGSITSTGAATVLAGTRVNMGVDTNVQVLDGQRYTLISGGAGSTVGATALTTTNTTLLRFVQDTTVTDKLEVYATRTQMSSTVTNPNNAAVGKMLDSMGAATNPEVIALQVLLQNYQNPADIEKALSTVTPEISGASAAASVAVANAASTIVYNRVNSLKDAAISGSGMASGDWVEGGHFWGQAFGAKADQDMRKRIAGYDADSYGLVVGADAEVADGFRAGIALTYGKTDVDGKDLNRSKSDIDSYQATLYGDYDLGNSYFVRGQLAYMYSDIDTARHNVGMVAGQTARANFHSDQYSARGEVGRNFALDNTFSLTPSVTTNYTYIDIEDYTERGAGGLSLRNVDTDEMEILEFGTNLVAEAQFSDTAGGTIRPNIHGGYRYDVIGDKVSTIGRLAGGGAAFKTEGFKPAQSTVNVGAGISWETSANIDFTLNYDYEHKSDYDAHSGFLRAGYKF